MKPYKQNKDASVDAERNRRTLEKQASHIPWFRGGAGSKSTKQLPKTTSNDMKEAPKVDSISMQNRARDAEALGERYWETKSAIAQSSKVL